MNQSSRKRGFTLVEIMIVTMIIGVLVAIAVPNFIRARESSRRNTCLANMTQIGNAKEQWAMDSKKATGDACALTDLVGATLYLKSAPSCPAGGTYTIGNVGDKAVCSKAAAPELHVLP